MTIGIERVNERLASLREEFDQGKAMLADLEREAAELRDGLLRIAGAIRALEDLSEDPRLEADVGRAETPS